MNSTDWFFVVGGWACCLADEDETTAAIDERDFLALVEPFRPSAEPRYKSQEGQTMDKHVSCEVEYTTQ